MILAEAKRIHVFGFFAEGKQIHVFWFLAEEKQTIVDKVGQALPDDI